MGEDRGRKAPRAAVTVEVMDPVLFHELSHIGNNLNQIARTLNRGREPVAGHLVEQLQGLFRILMADEVTARRIRSAERGRSEPAARPE